MASRPRAQRDRVRRDSFGFELCSNRTAACTFWGRGRSSPYVTVHVAHALAAARSSHGVLAKPMIDRVLPYLRSLDSGTDLDAGDVAEWVLQCSRRSTCVVSWETATQPGSVAWFTAAILRTPREGAGWLLAALADDAASGPEIASLSRARGPGPAKRLSRALRDRVTKRPTAACSSPATERVDAVVLDALPPVGPDIRSDPKLTAACSGLAGGEAGARRRERGGPSVAPRPRLPLSRARRPDFSRRRGSTAASVLDDGVSRETRRATSVVVPLDDADARHERDHACEGGRGLLRYRLASATDLDWDTSLRWTRACPSPAVRSAGRCERRSTGGEVRGISVRCARSRPPSRVAPCGRNQVALVSPLPAGLEP